MKRYEIEAWQREYPHDDAELAAYALDHTTEGALVRFRLAARVLTFEVAFALGFTATDRGWRAW